MNSPQGPKSTALTAAAILLLAMMALLAGGSARRESVTVDEIAHIGAGVSALQKLDLRMNEEHPPLAKVLAAIPLVLRGVHADYSSPSWSFSGRSLQQFLGEWVWGHWVIMTWNDPASTLFWARIPMLLLMLALGFALYRFGTKLGSPLGGLLCLCAYCTMPAFIVFGPLVLTDIVATFFVLLALWAFADLWQAPTRTAILRLGLTFGAALLSKFSAGLLFFFFVAFALSLRLRPFANQPTERAELRAWRRTRWKALIQSTLLAALVVYAVYFVLSWNEPTDTFSMIPHFPASPLLRRLLMPPWIFLRGLLMFAMTSSRATYILGTRYPHGVWFYFPILFMLKSPLPFLALLFLALVAALVARFIVKTAPSPIPQAYAFHWRAIWVGLIVFTGACLISPLAISIRHFSVPLVLLILMLAPLPATLHALELSGLRLARAGSLAVCMLSLCLVVVAVRTYPHYFPFLNSLSRGRPIYELVNDSNADWNQALPEVREWVEHRGLQHVLLDEYGTTEPTVYVPQAQFWDCQQPSASDASQWAIVSANMIYDGHNCPWLLQYPHENLAAGSMVAFQLGSTIPPAGAPNGPPLRKDWHSFGGVNWQEDGRLVMLNCTRNPASLQSVMDGMMAQFQEEMKKREEMKKAKAKR